MALNEDRGEVIRMAVDFMMSTLSVDGSAAEEAKRVEVARSAFRDLFREAAEKGKGWRRGRDSNPW